MLLDQSKTSGGINLFYAGRNAADLGEEYYRQQQELEGSSGIQRATQTGFAAFGLHSYRNLKSSSTNYSRSLGQALTPGRGFTSGLGVGYMLFGGDDPLEDSAQILGTAAAFKLADTNRFIPKAKNYVGSVTDAFINDTNFESPFKQKGSALGKIYDNKYGTSKHSVSKSLSSSKLYVTNPELRQGRRQLNSLNNSKKSSGIFSLFNNKTQSNLKRANRLSIQSNMINTVNKLHPVIKKGNSFVETSIFNSQFRAATISNYSTLRKTGSLGVKARTPVQILDLAKRIGNRAYKDRNSLLGLAGSISKRRIAVGIGGVAAVAGYGAFKVAETAFDTFQKGLNLAQNSSRLDFGDGMAFNSGEAMSERQRALQAMANSNMNARSFLGEEAKFYS